MKKNIILSLISIFITVFSISCNDQDFVVSADKPLRVTYISPSDGAINIPLDQVITVKLSELVKEDTILNPINFYLENINDEVTPVLVESTLLYNAETLSVTLTPSQPLAYSTKYRVRMTKGVVKKDTSNSFGGELSIELSSVFTTINPEELYVVHSSPSASAWSVDIHSSIEVLFSLPVNIESVILGDSLVIEDISDITNPIIITPADTDAMVWSEDNKKLVFTPKDIFGYSKTIRVTLTKDVKTGDATVKSGFLKENVVIVFKTIDPPMLGLTSIESASSFIPLKVDFNGETDQLIFTFTEGVYQDSIRLGDTVLIEDVTEVVEPLTGNAIGVIDGSFSFNAGDTPVNNELIGDDNVVTFTPTNKLQYGALLRVTLKGEDAPSMNGIFSDRATERGGQLPKTIVYLIQVEKLDKLYVISTNVAGSASVIVDTDVEIKLNQKIDCDTMANSDLFYINQGVVSDPDNKLQNFSIICENGVSDTITIDVNDISCSTGSFCYNEFYTVTLEGGYEGICVPEKNPNDTSDDGCIESPEYSFTFKTENIGNLYVVDTNVSGSESVLSDTNIMIKLNKEIACTMATDLNFYINKGITSDSANKVNDFDVICENGLSDTIVLDVNDLSCGTGNLCFNTSYTVTLEGGADGICVPYKNVNDLSDDGCIQDPLYNFTFKTETLKNLYILSTNAAGSSTFDYNSDITIKLSEEISCDMATNLNFYINKGVVSDSANKVDGFQVICNNGLSDTIVLDVNDLSCSTGGLCFNTSYTVTLEGGYEGICAPYKNVNDTTDNDCIKDPFSFFTFKTMELPEFVAVIEPMHNSTAIPLAVNPKITFSESINVTSVTTEIGADTDGVVNNICLVKGRNATDCSSPDVISITYVYTEGETVVTLVPNASLLADTDYTVVVSRDIKDVNSRNLSGFYSSSFKTSPGGLLSHIIVNNPDTITQLNIEMFFTEDVNVETLSNKTVYLTFVNEFDGTTYVPGTIEFPIGCNQVDNSNCTSAIFTPDFLTLFGCGENSLSPQYDLPLNTQFNLHLSSLIQNSNYINDPLHVPISSGDNEYIYNFTTKNNNLISSVKYSNAVVVNAVNLNLSNEVPVNSTFTIEFERSIDPSSLDISTVEIEDSRGDNGAIIANTSNFSTTKAGTFVVGRDEDKFITLFGTSSDNGRYKILSVTDDKTVVIDTVFNNTESSIYWRRTISDDSFDFSVNDNNAVIRLDKNLMHHVDYSGDHGVTTSGTNNFTLNPDLENFKFLSNRDIGKKIILSENNNINDGIVYSIVSVNETTNTLTLDGAVFSSNETEVAWRIFDNEDYHRLIVKGRSVSNKTNYLKELDGTPIEGIGYYKFFTSPGAYITFSPKTPIGDPLHQLENLSAISTRRLFLTSVNQNNFYTVQHNIKRTGLITYSSDRDNVVVLIPSPALERLTDAYLYITEDVLDYRGNPIISNSKYFNDITNAPATSALKCDDMGLTDGGKGPSIVDGSVIKGNQSILIKFGDASSSHECEILPISINRSSILLLEIERSGIDGNTTTGTDVFSVDTADTFEKQDIGKYLRVENGDIFKVLDVLDGTTLKIEGNFLSDGTNLQWELFNFIPFDVNFIPRGRLGDYAEIIPTQDMTSGKDIILSIDTSKISTVYLFSSDSILNYNYTVEEVAPSVTNVFATQENDSFASIYSQIASDIKADTEIMVVFDEDIREDSSNFKIKDELGNLYDFTLKVENNVAILTPNQPLKVKSGAFDYEVIIENVRDRAGNMLANSERGSFFIENTSLSVISSTPSNADSGVSVNSLINVKFNEAIDPSTLTTSTLSQDGSFKVSFNSNMNCEQDIRNQIFGCVALNNTKDKFTFTPQSPYNLIDETVFNASLSTMITDKAGNSLVSDYDFSFDTIAGDDGAPIAMCVDLLDDAGESTIDIYFNEDLDVNSLNSDSITVYEVDSGLIVTGSSVITNNMISFTPDSILDSNKVYALIVYDDITDLNGVSLVEIFRTFFNGSNL